MKVTVIADDADKAMVIAIEKQACKGFDFTALRAYQLAPRYAPRAWYVEGYERPLPQPEPERELVPA